MESAQFRYNLETLRKYTKQQLQSLSGSRLCSLSVQVSFLIEIWGKGGDGREETEGRRRKGGEEREEMEGRGGEGEEERRGEERRGEGGEERKGRRGEGGEKMWKGWVHVGSERWAQCFS